MGMKPFPYQIAASANGREDAVQMVPVCCEEEGIHTRMPAISHKTPTEEALPIGPRKLEDLDMSSIKAGPTIRLCQEADLAVMER